MTGPTINDVLDIYYDARSKTVTEPNRLHHSYAAVRRLLGELPAADIGQERIDRYVRARVADGVKPQTAGRELQCLLSGARLAHRMGRLPPVPSLTLPPEGRSRIRVLSQEEVAALLGAARDPRLRLFITLGLATAARRQAICELTWDHVDLERRVIDYRAPHPRAGRRKGRAVVPISQRLAEMLALIRPVSGQGLVVGLTPNAVTLQFVTARRRAGLGPDVTPHVLRHTAASTMIQSAPLIMVSKMLGHANTSITEPVYIHLRTDDLRPAAEAAAAMLPVLPLTPPPAPAPQGPGRLARFWSGLRRLFAKKPKPSRRKSPGRSKSHMKGAKRT